MNLTGALHRGPGGRGYRMVTQRAGRDRVNMASRSGEIAYGNRETAYSVIRRKAGIVAMTRTMAA